MDLEVIQDKFDVTDRSRIFCNFEWIINPWHQAAEIKVPNEPWQIDNETTIDP